MTEATDDRLKLLIERAERLIDEEKAIRADKNDVFMEAKAVGYDVKIMKLVIKLRAMRPDERQELDMLTDAYRSYLGID